MIYSALPYLRQLISVKQSLSTEITFTIQLFGYSVFDMYDPCTAIVLVQFFIT